MLKRSGQLSYGKRYDISNQHLYLENPEVQVSFGKLCTCLNASDYVCPGGKCAGNKESINWDLLDSLIPFK